MIDNYLCYTHTHTQAHIHIHKHTHTDIYIYIYVYIYIYILRFPLVYIRLVSNTTYLLQYYTSSKFVEIPNQNTLT